jgi:mannan endo-1,4-beta-mannosidase
LENAGIAVLFRPFHEMNGDFFWWSYQDRFKELWIYEWNYLTNTKKCNNLLFVFGVNYYGNAAATSKQSPSYYYPGHAYVDVLGCDFYLEYGHSYDKRIHDELRTLGGGKPIAIAENGQMPDIPTMRATQPYWVYWSTWWGFESASHGNTDALYTKNYADPSVITQDEVSIPSAVFPYARNAPEDNARQGMGVGFFTHQNGLFVTTKEICDGATLYGVNGKKIMTLRGNPGALSNSRLPVGTYIFRAPEK